MSGEVLLAAIADEKLSVDDHRRLVDQTSAGATVVFCGVVRDHDGGRGVTELEYVGHPSAGEVLRAVAERIVKDPDVLALAVSHRVGSLQVGDVALAAAVSCAHRSEAFAACARLVDGVKHELPIWKRQVFLDGTDEWVNCP